MLRLFLPSLSSSSLTKDPIINAATTASTISATSPTASFEGSENVKISDRESCSARDEADDNRIDDMHYETSTSYLIGGGNPSSLNDCDYNIAAASESNKKCDHEDEAEIKNRNADTIGSKKLSCDGTATPENHPQHCNHGLREGDHVIRWKMLGLCYPIQIHGIVLSAGPDIVTIVDCGLTSSRGADKVGNFQDDMSERACKLRKRLNILTLVDDKEIKKWKKVGYGEEVTLKVHSSPDEKQHDDTQQFTCCDEAVQSASDYHRCNRILLARNDNLVENDEDEQKSRIGRGERYHHETTFHVESDMETQHNLGPHSSMAQSKTTSFWCLSSPKTKGLSKFEKDDFLECSNAEQKQAPVENRITTNKGKGAFTDKQSILKLPKSDPPALVLARLRFLLVYGEESITSSNNEKPNEGNSNKSSEPPLLPPHHLLYANSECIAVWCKTWQWSTLQASVFLHLSAIGNAKQTATLAMLLNSQTVTVPASGIGNFWRD
mmetsp:Transcript_24089/g.48086  ORF Transcript_24089/g.48086 Transcript_24089/m.48086 type:complete len:494 (+) Transcript_24089:48-1529(+)